MAIKLETHNAPSDTPVEEKPVWQPPQPQQPMETHGNAGMGRVTETLGIEPDFIDCSFCQKRNMTTVKREPSQATLVAQFFCALAFFPCCTLCLYPVPKKREWWFNTRHKRSMCDKDVAFISHDINRIDARYVQSQFGS
ncbi:Uu.00g144960.m01.CDS01 [Anthostomella pinea]|uniref:Uu.00g144960.m01.CDS01 n=1 Tax=Anthostomella pinea TaxID=933095 RepID=A0AAI8YLY1_9PEZI|nr:Uu.00g144960.m01.CDS01 [Anthostomella pinea]